MGLILFPDFQLEDKNNNNKKALQLYIITQQQISILLLF